MIFKFVKINYIIIIMLKNLAFW